MEKHLLVNAILPELIIILITIIIGIFAIKRNNWVCRKQIEIIGNPHELEYLSYSQMFIRFWVWNVEKLKRKSKRRI